MTSLPKRFWDKVNKNAPNGCWEWTASTNNGYGQLRVDGKTPRAHRLSAADAGMDIEGLYVCHHCDNPPCVNPAHLFVGTAKDNMQDCLRKGRTRYIAHVGKGEKAGCVKLTLPQVLAIRAEWELPDRRSGKELGAAYGVTKATISSVVRRKNWSHV